MTQERGIEEIMKVCIVINHFQVSDGVARAAVGVANALADVDIEATIITLFKYDSAMKNKLNPKVKVKPVFGFYVNGLAKIIDLLPDKLLYKLFIREKYDIEIGFCMILPSKIIASSTNSSAKHYLWMHGYDSKIVLKAYYLKADKVISVSQHNATKLLNDIPELKEVAVCHNLINNDDVITQGNQESELQKEDCLLAVTVGRQSPEKGYERLIDCVYRLKQHGHIIQLCLIGKGSEHDNLVRKVSSYDMQDQIFFLGEQENPHKYTKRADIFICSSYSEGYSTACTEAIMLGIPVLSTRVSGAEEIIGEAEAGMVVDNEDNSLYEGLLYLIENPQIIDDWKKKLQTTKEKFYYSNRKKELFDTLGL